MLHLQFGKTRRSLRVNIGLAFSLLIAILGATLITFAHERHRQIALLTASELFDRATAQLAADIGVLYSPAESLVSMTATLGAELPDIVNDRQLLFAHLAGALRERPKIQAVFVGRANGDFYSLRNLNYSTAELTLRTSTPITTRFLAQIIKREGGVETYENIFLDNNLEQLSASDAFITGYDPRIRQWYNLALKSTTFVHSDFYEFFTTGDTGVTIAQQIGNTGDVIGVDITLNSLAATLQNLSPTPSAEIVVFTSEGKLLISNKSDSKQVLESANVRAPGAGTYVGDFDQPVLDELFHRFIEGERNSTFSLEAGGEAWFTSIRPVRMGAGQELAFMAIAASERDLLSALERLRMQSILLALLALAIALLMAWLLSSSISSSAARLAAEAREMTRLRFHSPLTVRSRIADIDELACSMAVMKSALLRFTRVAESLSAEEGSSGVARVALAEARAMCGADNASLMLLSDDRQRLVLFESDSPPEVPESLMDEKQNLKSGFRSNIGQSGSARALGNRHKKVQDINLTASMDGEGSASAELSAMESGRAVVLYEEHDDEQSVGDDKLSQKQKGRSEVGRAYQLIVPLTPAGESAIGIIKLSVNEQGLSLRCDEECIHFIEALASAGAVAMRNRQLIEAQHSTFESMMRLLAKAIDAKSPYTGAHCQRVPVIVEQLARAASQSSAVPFRDFQLDEAHERELHIASWLHDCGKITTPEHLVDKGTKLEGVFNRIHEIRTRFEVLHRDAEIDFLRSTDGASKNERAEAKEKLLHKQAVLQEKFAFVANCNDGLTAMSAQSVANLESIASQTWVRHFDNTLGLSIAERERLNRSHPLPVTENLLANRPEHRVRRQRQFDTTERQRHGFNDFVPEFEHDAGELHNLTVLGGTLTVEERHRINDHVNQTILLLEDVPFPKELAQVPRIAGNHHEKLDGSGYPRGLKAGDLTIEDRILTIADVFEALTAGDRPYKRAKTLSETIAILRKMSNKGEIDGDLLELFMASGIPENYAMEHLHPDQIDLPHLMPLIKSRKSGVDIYVGELTESLANE